MPCLVRLWRSRSLGVVKPFRSDDFGHDVSEQLNGFVCLKICFLGNVRLYHI